MLNLFYLRTLKALGEQLNLEFRLINDHKKSEILKSFSFLFVYYYFLSIITF